MRKYVQLLLLAIMALAGMPGRADDNTRTARVIDTWHSNIESFVKYRCNYDLTRATAENASLALAGHLSSPVTASFSLFVDRKIGCEKFVSRAAVPGESKGKGDKTKYSDSVFYRTRTYLTAINR
jgi:hypothetical protein